MRSTDMMKQLAAVAFLATVAACGATQAAATSPEVLPVCTTWQAPSGSQDVLRLHQTGSTFTGTDSAGGLTATIKGRVTGPHTFDATLTAPGGIPITIHGFYTRASVKLAGQGGHDTFSTSRGCPF